jgi:hypothetical protein
MNKQKTPSGIDDVFCGAPWVMDVRTTVGLVGEVVCFPNFNQ